MNQTMHITIGFADSDYQTLQYENLVNQQFEVAYNYHNLITINNVKFVEYYLDSIKITTSNYKSCLFELKDITTFEVVVEKQKGAEYENRAFDNFAN